MSELLVCMGVTMAVQGAVFLVLNVQHIRANKAKEERLDLLVDRLMASQYQVPIAADQLREPYIKEDKTYSDFAPNRTDPMADYQATTQETEGAY